jgi:hypothetical protein
LFPKERGTGIIIIEIDENCHEIETIETQQLKQTAIVLEAKKAGHKWIYLIRVNVAQNKNASETQVDKLKSIIENCADAIRSENEDRYGVHMIMLDYPCAHYHVHANLQRTAPHPSEEEEEEENFVPKMAEEENDTKSFLFNSFDVDWTTGFKDGYCGLTEEQLDKGMDTEGLDTDNDTDDDGEDDLEESDED